MWPSYGLSDVTSRAAARKHSFRTLLPIVVAKLFDIIFVVFTVIMSESDEIVSTKESFSIGNGSDCSRSDEMEVVGIVQHC